MYADRNIIVDCHKTIDGGINFLRGSSRLEIRLGAVKPPRLGQQGSKGPSPRFQHYTLVSFDNFISYSALFPAVRFYVLHEQMEKRHDPSWTFFHEKTPARVRGGRYGRDRSLLEYSE